MHLGPFRFFDLALSSLAGAIAAVLVVVAALLVTALAALVARRMLGLLVGCLGRITASADEAALPTSGDNVKLGQQGNDFAPVAGNVSHEDARDAVRDLAPQEATGTPRAERLSERSSAFRSAESPPIGGQAGVHPIWVDEASKLAGGVLSKLPRNAKPHFASEPDSDRNFDRNSGVPGFLYVARNDLHLPGLFKLGQTCLTVGERVRSLNKSLDHAREIGRFDVVAEVQTDDAFGTEQRAFERLRSCRAIDQREFFFGDPQLFLAVFNSVARGEREEDFLATWGAALAEASASKRAVERAITESVPPKIGAGSGWVYLTRNDYHVNDVFGIGWSETDPVERIERRNRSRRELSGCIGFAKIVRCVPTYQPSLVMHKMLYRFRRSPVDPRRRFVRATLSELSGALDEFAVLMPPVDLGPGSSFTSERDKHHSPPQDALRKRPRGKAHRESPPDQDDQTDSPVLRNSCPHPKCIAEIRTSGSVDSVRSLTCPSCRRRVEYFVENGALCVRRPYLT